MVIIGLVYYVVLAAYGLLPTFIVLLVQLVKVGQSVVVVLVLVGASAEVVGRCRRRLLLGQAERRGRPVQEGGRQQQPQQKREEEETHLRQGPADRGGEDYIIGTTRGSRIVLL